MMEAHPLMPLGVGPSSTRSPQGHRNGDDNTTMQRNLARVDQKKKKITRRGKMMMRTFK